MWRLTFSKPPSIPFGRNFMEFLAYVKLLGYVGFRVLSTSKETRKVEP